MNKTTPLKTHRRSGGVEVRVVEVPVGFERQEDVVVSFPVVPEPVQVVQLLFLLVAAQPLLEGAGHAVVVGAPAYRHLGVTGEGS